MDYPKITVTNMGERDTDTERERESTGKWEYIGFKKEVAQQKGFEQMWSSSNSLDLQLRVLFLGTSWNNFKNAGRKISPWIHVHEPSHKK